MDPCPTELELELPADGRLVFVSDVHLTGGGPVADFGAAGEFVELVDGLGRHDGEVLLVLGGDILDLLQAGGPPAEAVDRILGAGDAEAVARALREAAGRPRVRVVYLVGNHDAALAWHGAARRRVAEALGVTAVALRARITVRCQDGEAVTVLAEHGHALDVYNRHTDPFDPLDTPAGDHVVQEVVNRFDSLAPTRPDLALDQIDNVRPSSAVPLWLVSNFFYRFLRRTLRRFALPLFALFLLLHLPAVSLALRDLQGRTEEVERVVYRGLWWLVVIVAIDLVLLVALSAFLGRSLREAAAVYGGTPDDAESDLLGARRRDGRAAGDPGPGRVGAADRAHAPLRAGPRRARPGGRGRRLLGTRAGPGPGVAVAAAGLRAGVPVHLDRGGTGRGGGGRAPLGAAAGGRPPAVGDRAAGDAGSAAGGETGAGAGDRGGRGAAAAGTGAPGVEHRRRPGALAGRRYRLPALGRCPRHRRAGTGPAGARPAGARPADARAGVG